MNLKLWLVDQGLTVRELAVQLEAPLKTVEDWVYRGVVPSLENRDRLVEFIKTECKHHWLIETPNGPVSEGVCQRCGEKRGFMNSGASTPWVITRRPAE